MKKLTSVLMTVFVILFCATTVCASATNLTAAEEKFFQQRGFNAKEISGLSQKERDAMLSELHRSVSLFAAPADYVTVTNIPTQGTESFHPDTGQTNGDYFDQYNYLYMDWGPYNFAKMIFGQSIPQDKYMYYLWGEWDDKDKTHQGVDVKYVMATSSSIKNVKSAHEGEITYIDRSGYGVVAIYDGSQTHYYLHLKNIPGSFKAGVKVTLGQYIGDQGAVGLSNASYYHVHYEVRYGKQTNGPRPTSGLYTDSPYYPMASNNRSIPK